MSFATRAEAIGTAAILAVRREEFARIAIVHERVDVAVCYRPHTAAAAAVAAVWTALGNEFFAAKARNAIAAFAALNLNAGFVNEFHLNTVRKKLSQSQPFEGRFEQHNEKSPREQRPRQGFFSEARRRFHGTRRLN